MFNLQTPKENGETKTGILGGGLSGLTIGYMLNQNEQAYEILEKESECGGLMRTLNENSFSFDSSGSHIIFQNPRKF